MAKKIYIHREIEKTLREVVNQFPSLVVTGPRQSGKSTLLMELFSKDYTYVSFDDPVTRERAISDPEFFLDNLKGKVIIDEIQYVPQILSYVKIRIDRKRQKRGDFIFTGSQQFNMIKNLGDTLAGRVAIMELLPFSLKEKKKALKKRGNFDTTQEYFIHSCLCVFRFILPPIPENTLPPFSHFFLFSLHTIGGRFCQRSSVDLSH